MRASGWLAMAGMLVAACGGNHSGGGGAPASHSLTIHVAGGGSVQSASPSFTCTADCEKSVAGGTVVLSASADNSGPFMGWQGDCSGTTTCTLDMSANRSVTATFAGQNQLPPGELRLSVDVTGAGVGRVTSTPKGIDCPGTCEMATVVGSPVTLTAQPAAGSMFSGWSGGCAGQGSCTISKSQAAATADFEPIGPPPPLPPQCAGLTPALPAPPVSATISTPAFCGYGLGDASGTIGLTAIGSPHGVTLHFIDEVTGQERAFTSNFDGMDGKFTQQPDGFTGVMKSPAADSWSVHYWSKDGVYVAASSDAMNGGPVAYAAMPAGGVVVAGLRTVTGLPPTPQQFLDRFDMGATRQWAAALATLESVFGVGGDLNGAILVISNGGGGSIAAQWFDDRGMESASFTLIDSFQPGSNTWFETAPLIGGGVAVRRVDQQNDPEGRPYRTAQWLKTVAANTARAQDVPAWLAARPDTDLALARSGRAYAVLPMGTPNAPCGQRVEILAPDGTACGWFDASVGSGQCRTEDLRLGKGDTPIQLMPKGLSAPNVCSYRWWPHALR